MRVTLRSSIAAIWLAALVGLVGQSNCATSQEFYGELVLRPLAAEQGQYMEVVKIFGFKDVRKRVWEVPPGYKTDGASIPPILWPIFGAPFSGNYLKAAVLHDVYCDLKSRPWGEVHKLFYEAMIAARVDEVQAKIMYYAVYRFGPRWIANKLATCPPNYRCNQERDIRIKAWNVKPDIDVAEFEMAASAIRSKKIDLSEIAQMGEAGFRASRAHVVQSIEYDERLRPGDDYANTKKEEWVGRLERSFLDMQSIAD